MEIVNRNLQISKQDIDNCSDKHQLKDWLYSIQSEIGELNIQLKEANMEYKLNNCTYSDPTWYKKASSYRHFQVILLNSIKKRLSILNNSINYDKLNVEREFFRNKLKKVKPLRFKKYISELNDILLEKGLIE